MSNNYDHIIRVRYPHGYLLWKGKQTAIASDERLPVGERALIVEGDEAFGVATLARPAQLMADEFDQHWWAQQHRIWPKERKMYWPGVKALYVHELKSWQPFDQGRLFVDGQLVDYEPSPEEARLLERAGELSTRIVLDAKAVALSADGKSIICPGICRNPDLERELAVIFGGNLEYGEADKAIPIYSLALVRRPVMRVEAVKKKEMKQESDMPWEIREDFEDCADFAVVKIDNDEIEGCHETEEEAQDQLAALNIAEEEADEEGEAAATDKQLVLGIVARDDEICIVDIEADEALACFEDEAALLTALQIEIEEEPEADEEEPEPEMEAEEEERQHEDDEEEEEEASKAGRRLKNAMMTRLEQAMSTIKELLAWASYDDRDDKMFTGRAGFAIKEVNGEPWLFTWSANAFKDREEEIFSTKSLERWARKVESQEIKGYFNVYHIQTEDDPALTDFAEKRWVGVPGRILVEAGPFLKNEKGQAALKFLRKYKDGHPEVAPEGWGCSIEYRYLPEEREKGVYENVEITRTSVLPKFAAANIWTQVKEVKAMAMTDEQKQVAIKFFGQDLGESLIGGAEEKSKELEANVDHKSNGKKETPEAGVTLEAVVEAVAQKMETDFTPFNEAMVEVANHIKALADRVESLEKGQKIKEDTESPRFVFSLQRASEAKSTIAEDDLTDKKPKEKQPHTDGSMAAAFFPSRK